jgi:predicted DNA-binding transcriptional regulator YafY
VRRAERLFQIVQILRRARRPVTAAELADELEVSKRSVYRDVAGLIGQRTPIRGEAGIGYVLDDAFDMPPLMLTPDEIEAAVLGAQWVARHGDPVLARAAEDLVAKIAATVPAHLRAFVLEPVSATPPPYSMPQDGLDIGAVRTAIRGQGKIALRYRDVEGTVSRRTIWPIAIGYFQHARVLVGWCEIREDFRSFRTDRIEAAIFLDARFPERASTLRRKWRQKMMERRNEAPTAISSESSARSS